ncbi:uncharacterized protein LOC111895812 [Lactuca sativa]|uniref:uncharacterized protein LOC111895812 n=1 Tax=Lactuca sativa TaxID=4236 RepID=UPI0022B0791A|nr:uncharacterized protein LOC111895812 [Lactuca sativa]
MERKRKSDQAQVSGGFLQKARVSFIVNDISALILFDAGATQSFVSLVLIKRFAGAPGELDYPLKFDLADDRSIQVSRVHRGCVLEIFNDQFPIDMVPIPLYGNIVIVGMNWLSPNGAVIDSECHMDKATVDDVLIVREYTNVFPKELPGVPPERQVEFRIDLVPDAAPIAE